MKRILIVSSNEINSKSDGQKLVPFFLNKHLKSFDYSVEILILSDHADSVKPIKISSRILRGFRGELFSKNKYIFSSIISKFDKEYDFVFFNSISSASEFFDSEFRFSIISKKNILGLNDCKTSQYFDNFKELVYSKMINYQKLKNSLLTPLAYLSEKKILNKVDLVHLQTKREREHILLIHGKKYHSKSFFLRNGSELADFNINHSDKPNSKRTKIFLLGHLSVGRKIEIEWFVKKVFNKLPNDKFELLIGGRIHTKELPKYLKKENIKLVGFVDNLINVKQYADILVLPTFHGTGHINRFLDFISLNMPIVTTNRVITSFSEFNLESKFIKSTNSSVEFIRLIVNFSKLQFEKETINHDSLLNNFVDWKKFTSEFIKKIE
jgi:hypothetical protein